MARRPKVVVIDDDEVIRELAQLHLVNAGYEVLLAEDPVVAGHLVLKSSPALILIDVNMPYMNGYEFTAALRADRLLEVVAATCGPGRAPV